MKTAGLCFALALGFGYCAGSHATEMLATDDAGLRVLESVLNVHPLYDGKNDLAIRLFETGGGDPAVNGVILLLVIIPGDQEQRARVWNTGIDVYTVNNVQLDSERSLILIEVSEHYADDASGMVRERRQLYTIEYAVDSATGVLSDVLRLSHTRSAGRPAETEQTGQGD